MSKIPLGDIRDAKQTKDAIMLQSAILFAHRGYAAVSMKDIAKVIGINPSAIYYHFQGKEALFNAIIDNIKDLYLAFFCRTDNKINKANSYKDILDSLFSELKDIYQIFIFYGVSLISCEQFRNPHAREVFNDVYMKKGIEYAETLFNESIEKGWVKPFNTKALAVLFMNSVFTGSIMVTHADMKNNSAYDPEEMWNLVYDYMLNSVEANTI